MKKGDIQMTDTIVKINDFLNSIVWGVPTIILMLGTGLFLTIKLNFLQFRNFGYLFNRSVVKAFTKKDDVSDADKKAAGEVTSFQAAMISISAIVGSGNIAGIATAIISGGPGAMFWMIVAAFIGMATKLSEIALGIKYRKVNADGKVSGGPMYYIANGLKWKWLGVFVSVCVMFYAFVISAVVDTNTIASVMHQRFDVSVLITGIVLAVATAICIFGGSKRVGKVCELLAPFMGGAYILAGLVIIILNIKSLPQAVVIILEAAFNPRAMTGGAVGSIFVVMRYGLARGIYSNEAGVGTAAMIHCGAKVDHPMEQAVWGPVEVFLDTVLVCTISGLAIVLSGLYTDAALTGANLTMAAFDLLLPGNWGGIVCLGAILLFGFSCLISFCTYAERGAEFIFGEKSRMIVRVVWIIVIIFGAISGESIVWDIADTVNGLIIIPNLIALIILSKEIVAMKKEYIDKDLAVYKRR